MKLVFTLLSIKKKLQYNWHVYLFVVAYTQKLWMFPTFFLYSTNKSTYLGITNLDSDNTDMSW